ncbi:hypothetical protein SAMN05920897_10366 [Alkalispirochaeta americana]|uniref:6-bladed beta-propeller protein n=1 Tax=Alkalispirochaeta americana TaxID=159291 RepID=A0A1N6PNQ9_9SPIO|nr:hypothetical protein [Alkalispirochaeta americana]SIQ06000.1 hypothetical protein SAMN05920897_10366 [Alkalispirochaeta americana]
MADATRPFPVLSLTGLSALLLSLLFSLLFSGCDDSAAVILEREERFRLGLGFLEDELGLFGRDNTVPQQPNSVVMRDGLVFVGNGSANKIMGFTSFGDLVRLIYQPRDNPRPVTLSEGNFGEESGTRRAVPFPFEGLGRIAVDSRRFLYAEDRIPRNRAIWDEELGVHLNRQIFRFDNNGQMVDYLGQEGIGGTPFPFIHDLTVTKRDELAVITRIKEGFISFFYSSEGDFLTAVEIGRDRLPLPSEDEGYIPVLNEVVAGVDEPRLYVKISYYRAQKDAAAGRDHGIALDHARVYWIDLVSGRYEGFVELPRGNGEEHFELTGVARGEHLFLLSRENPSRVQLVIMNDEGRVLRRRSLEVSEVDLTARSFYLCYDGVLTALLGYHDQAQVVWWRSDRLLPQP